ncbi:MAG: helix-turn-helix domain-containing protein [Patescibacteria group bacterium]
MLIDVLINIGLTKKEAKVYLACLELGSSIVSEIAKRAKINRVTTYDILEKLIQKGYINFITKYKIKYFNPTKPDLVFAETKKHTEDFQKALPDLKRLHGETPHPRVRYFEGIAGIKAIYADTLTSKTDILNYANSKEIRDFWPNYDEEYVAKRAKKKIYLHGLAPADEAGEKVVKENRKYYRNIRLVSKKKYDFSNEINIYDNKFSIISFGEGLIGMIIESKEIADTQRTIFKMAWKLAKK